MKMIVDIRLPLEPFNTMVKNGTVGAAIEKVLGDIKPEAVYFSERDGPRIPSRTATITINIAVIFILDRS